MSTTVTFAGNLVEDPELHHTREGKPFVTCRVLVNRRVQKDAGEWVDDEPTRHNVKGFSTAANNLYDSADRGDRILVHGLLRTESWIDKETGEKRNRNVVVVDNWFGEVSVSLKHAAARLDGRSAAAATARAAMEQAGSAAPLRLWANGECWLGLNSVSVVREIPRHPGGLDHSVPLAAERSTS